MSYILRNVAKKEMRIYGENYDIARELRRGAIKRDDLNRDCNGAKGQRLSLPILQ